MDAETAVEGPRGRSCSGVRCERRSRSRVPAPAVRALQGEALGLPGGHRAGRAAQVGAVGSCGVPRGIRVLRGPERTLVRGRGAGGARPPTGDRGHPEQVSGGGGCDWSTVSNETPFLRPIKGAE